jgi:hypothetical protein
MLDRRRAKGAEVEDWNKAYFSAKAFALCSGICATLAGQRYRVIRIWHVFCKRFTVATMNDPECTRDFPDNGHCSATASATQQTPSGRGKVFQIRTLPSVWCGEDLELLESMLEFYPRRKADEQIREYVPGDAQKILASAGFAMNMLFLCP